MVVVWAGYPSGSSTWSFPRIGLASACGSWRGSVSAGSGRSIVLTQRSPRRATGGCRPVQDHDMAHAVVVGLHRLVTEAVGDEASQDLIQAFHPPA
jgi:hypothetical protein